MSFERQEVIDDPEIGPEVIGGNGDRYGRFTFCHGEKGEDLITHPFVEGGPGLYLSEER